MKKYIINKEAVSLSRLEYLSMAGVCLVVLVQLLSIQQLSPPLIISVTCFCFAQPLLITTAMMLRDRSFQHHINDAADQHIKVPSLKGPLFLFVGLVGIPWHFGWEYGLMFLGASLYGLGQFQKHHKELMQSNTVEEETKNQNTDASQPTSSKNKDRPSTR